jgi:hypothetical protein
MRPSGDCSRIRVKMRAFEASPKEGFSGLGI